MLDRLGWKAASNGTKYIRLLLQSQFPVRTLKHRKPLIGTSGWELHHAGGDGGLEGGAGGRTFEKDSPLSAVWLFPPGGRSFGTVGSGSNLIFNFHTLP